MYFVASTSVQHRVGVGVDALHQIAVDGELLAVQSGQNDHRSVLGVRRG